MFGSGLLKGMRVTLRHLVDTYVDDVKSIPSRYAGGKEMLKQEPDQRGLFTIQYPEERRQLPERFRYLPMLLEDRCTACGICAKVCPPQCIWIERATDENGKSLKRPANYTIDTSICMGCGFCAEFCTFDAIRMNHDYELAFETREEMLFDEERLSVPMSHYAELYPIQWAEEEAALQAKASARAGA
ncbi:MAG TPA: NADH-quinone oxidoreductase subunit I [Anaerolineae bacterium]|nr:NADH-quinone oxidoreductase subunit I [Anaerolineae bacterium]